VRTSHPSPEHTAGSNGPKFRTWLRIPVKWAGDSGEVGQSRSEATLVVFYISCVAHMSQEKGK
jgi:hypothetical protein